MLKRLGWVCVPALCGLLASAALAAEKDKGQSGRLEVGKPAPDFTLKDLEGKEHTLSKLSGKVVVLEWTNHQCPFVQRHQEDLKTMQKTYASLKDKGIVWLAIDSSHFCEKESESIKAFAKDVSLPYPILLDASGEVGKKYHAKTTPHMFVIDKEGNLAYEGAIDDDPGGKKKGEGTKNYVDMAVNAVLAGSAVQETNTKPYGCSVKYAK